MGILAQFGSELFRPVYPDKRSFGRSRQLHCSQAGTLSQSLSQGLGIKCNCLGLPLLCTSLGMQRRGGYQGQIWYWSWSSGPIPMIISYIMSAYSIFISNTDHESMPLHTDFTGLETRGRAQLHCDVVDIVLLSNTLSTPDLVV